MIKDIIAQLGKIAVTSLKLGREVAREKATETVDALKNGKAAHWLHDTLVRLGVVDEVAPAPAARKAPARKAAPGMPPRKAGLGGHQAASAARH